jgi:hypothetical protein
MKNRLKLVGVVAIDGSVQPTLEVTITETVTLLVMPMIAHGVMRDFPADLAVALQFAAPVLGDGFTARFAFLNLLLAVGLHLRSQ